MNLLMHSYVVQSLTNAGVALASYVVLQVNVSGLNNFVA